MKKITTACSILFLGFAFFSKAGEIELKKSKPSKNNDKATNKVLSEKALSPNATTQSGFWSDDFSVPANWTKSSPTGAGLWTIGTAAPGCPPYNIPAILSTTAANGFGMFDSNCDCSHNQIANITTTNSISCTGHPFVNLTFQEQYRRYDDSTFVFVSKDNINWVKYPVNVSLGNTDLCANNSTTVKVNISATAGGQATVWIRFQFYSPSTLSGLPGCAYAWMIDDAALSDVPTNDMGMDRAYTDFSYLNGGYYTQTPKTQVAPLTFRGAVSNQGTAIQTNVKLSVNILNGTSSVYNQNNTVASIPAYGVDTLSITTPFTPPATLASYTTQFHVSQTEVEATSDTANNWISKTFAVTDTVYARDNNTLTGTTSPNAYTNGAQDDSRIGNIYEFNTAATASSISAYIASTTATGTTIQAKIYIEGAGFTEIAASATYAINSSTDVGKWVTLPISAPLQMDSTYLAAIVTTGVSSGTPNVFVYLGADKVTQQPIRTSYVYTAGDGKWGYISELPMIRLNIKTGTTAGVNQLSKNDGVKLYQNVPNPTRALSTINYELDQNANVTLTVYDVVGKKISVQNEGTQSAGQHSIIFNAGNLSAGVYYYSLSVGQKNTSTMKMVVVK